MPAAMPRQLMSLLMPDAAAACHAAARQYAYFADAGYAMILAPLRHAVYAAPHAPRDAATCYATRHVATYGAIFSAVRAAIRRARALIVRRGGRRLRAKSERQARREVWRGAVSRRQQ